MLPEILTSPLGLIAVVLSMVFLICCGTAPRVALLLSLFAGYNPAFSYYFLLSQAFRGGEVRAALSTICVMVLALAIALRRGALLMPKPIATVGRCLVFWLVFPLIACVPALFHEYELREIVAELLPLVEFAAYFWVAALIIRTSADAEAMVRGMVLWTGLVGAAELVEFVTLGSQVTLRIDLAGRISGRLTDFMPVSMLPIAAAFLLRSQGKGQRILFLLATGCMAAVVTVSYYRSVWLACLAALLMLGLLTIWKRSNAHRLGRTVLGTALAAGLGLSILILALGAQSGLLWGDISARFDPGQLFGAEQSSTLGRLSFVRDILDQSLASPIWGQGLGAPFYSNWASRTLLITDAPNFYLKLLYQLGILGFGGYLFALGVVVRQGFRSHQAVGGSSSILSAGILSGLFGFSVLAAVFPAFLHFPISPFSAVLLVCLFNLRTPDVLAGRATSWRLVPISLPAAHSAARPTAARRSPYQPATHARPEEKWAPSKL